MGFLEALKIALAAGLGLSIGYYVINIAMSLAMTKLQIILVKRAAAKHQKQEEQPSADKKCMKCKKNPRPQHGLYCPKCQFDGGHKF